MFTHEPILVTEIIFSLYVEMIMVHTTSFIFKIRSFVNPFARSSETKLREKNFPEYGAPNYLRYFVCVAGKVKVWLSSSLPFSTWIIIIIVSFNFHGWFTASLSLNLCSCGKSLEEVSYLFVSNYSKREKLATSKKSILFTTTDKRSVIGRRHESCLKIYL